MDIETARANMIEQQIRPWNVLAMDTLDALKQIRREDFVPAQYRDLAFADVQIPLGDGEVMLEPKVGARMLEALALGRTDRVLNIGTGSGYLAALLAAVGGHVTTVENNARLFDLAQRNLAVAATATASTNNASSFLSEISTQRGDAQNGWGEAGQFDAILIGGSLPTIADSWLNALADGGRLVGIEGQSPAMRVVLVTKMSAGKMGGETGERVVRRALFETVVPRLGKVDEKVAFEF